MTDEANPEYKEGAARFLLLVGAARVSKKGLAKASGVSTSTLTSYENAKRAPSETLNRSAAFSKMAKALGVSTSGLFSWWMDGIDVLLTVDLRDKIEQFRGLPPREQMERWRDLGWQNEQGAPRKPAPPRAGEWSAP